MAKLGKQETLTQVKVKTINRTTHGHLEKRVVYRFFHLFIVGKNNNQSTSHELLK